MVKQVGFKTSKIAWERSAQVFNYPYNQHYQGVRRLADGSYVARIVNSAYIGDDIWLGAGGKRYTDAQIQALGAEFCY